MKVVHRTGVRVVNRNAGSFIDFPAKDFKVLDNGALELGGPERMTFAHGTWTCASFVLSEDDLHISPESAPK